MTEDDNLGDYLPSDLINPERHRRPAKKTEPNSDPRPVPHIRIPPPSPKPPRSGSKTVTLRNKYQQLAARYSGLAKQAGAADWDDVNMLGGARTEPIPSETVYTLQSDLSRMVVRDIGERDKEILKRFEAWCCKGPATSCLAKLMQEL